MGVSQNHSRILIALILALKFIFIAATINQAFAATSTSQDTSGLCIAAAKVAAAKTGVPIDVLMAITLTETGRTTENGLDPWPWVLNQAGKGKWFSVSEDAIQFAEDQLDLGFRNFDVGCFQLNHRWHSKGFTSTADMFDPVKNAVYAAQFLKRLYAEKGDWSLAAAAYHSRTQELADRYKLKFEIILANLTVHPREFGAKVSVFRINRFPLLQAGSKASFASIVPQLPTGVRLIGIQP